MDLAVFCLQEFIAAVGPTSPSGGSIHGSLQSDHKAGAPI
jgi:hypothetical protein